MTFKFDMDIKDIAILAVLIALFVLIVYAIKLVKKLMVTLENVDNVLGNTERVASIAADRTEQVDKQIDYAIDKFAELGLRLRDSKSIINKAGMVGTAAGAVKSYRKKKKHRANKNDISMGNHRRSKRIKRRG